MIVHRYWRLPSATQHSVKAGENLAAWPRDPPLRIPVALGNRFFYAELLAVCIAPCIICQAGELVAVISHRKRRVTAAKEGRLGAFIVLGINA